MALHTDFPPDPHVILDPAIRWYPGEEQFTDNDRATLLPPLMYKIRQGVKVWRYRDSSGAGDATKVVEVKA